MYSRVQQPSLVRGGAIVRRSALPTATGRLLRLQQTAGNRAVGRLLARQPVGTPDRPDPVEDAPKQRQSTVKIPDIGTLPVVSLSWATNGGRPSDVAISTQTGEHSPALMRAAAAGAPLGDVEITVWGGRVIILHDCIISSYKTGGSGGDGRPGAMETWTLNYGSIEYRHE
jgi:hypothetical protein